MKIVVFGPDRRVGALAGENVIDLNRANGQLPAGLEAFIAAGASALDGAQRVIDQNSGDGMQKAADAHIVAPWPLRRIACAGGNFAEHLKGMEANPDVTLDEVRQKARDRGQWGFWKVPAEVAGPGEDIPLPKRTQYFDYEGEAAIILGKRGKDIPASQIGDYVWGVTLLNDWSIRDLPFKPFPMSYNQPKNFDGSTSMGPCIVVGELNIQDVPVETTINGQRRQSYNTSQMIFSFAEILEELSKDFTFVPGDVISGGTNAGTAADQSKKGPDGTKPRDLFLKKGDVVEVSSPAIGRLRNTIV